MSRTSTDRHLIMSEITRHFTVSTFIVHEGRVLLLMHKQLGLWLPPGGHIERDELPQDAAVREAREETGLEIQLIGESEQLPDGSTMLIQPRAMNLHHINPFHQHIDMEFLACCREQHPQLNPARGESSQLRWFAPQDLDSDSLAYNVRRMAHLALEEVPAWKQAFRAEKPNHPQP